MSFCFDEADVLTRRHNLFLLPLPFLTLWATGYFCEHYAKLSKQLSMEWAKECDCFSDLKAARRRGVPNQIGQMASRRDEKSFTSRLTVKVELDRRDTHCHDQRRVGQKRWANSVVDTHDNHEGTCNEPLASVTKKEPHANRPPSRLLKRSTATEIASVELTACEHEMYLHDFLLLNATMRSGSSKWSEGVYGIARHYEPVAEGDDVDLPKETTFYQIPTIEEKPLFEQPLYMIVILSS